MTTWVVLASGPSMSQEVADAVRGLPTVAVSNCHELAPWADVLVSSDRSWWNHNPTAKDFAGEKFCGLCIEPPKEVQKFAGAMAGSNSGLLAIQVAVSKGATRVLLFGIDLGGSHYFGDHPAPLKNTKPERYEVFQKQFAGYHPKGVEILNCSPDSALHAYQFADPSEFLPKPEPEPIDLTGPRGEKGEPGQRGEKGIGERGPRGPEGPEGPMGPMPDHQWNGTSLRFQEPDGDWGKYVDLKGKEGNAGVSAGGGGGGGAGMTATERLQLNTLLAIFGGWIATAPTPTIENVVIDELQVSVEGEATGFYSTIPGGTPVGIAWEWDFGDGSDLVTTQDATHLYEAEGTYTISLRVRNHIGWSDPVTEEVEVSGALVPGDPNWANRLWLMPLQDASEKVSETDWTVQADGSFTLTNPKWPDRAFITGASGRLQGPSGSGVLGSGMFCVEGWARTTTHLDADVMVANYELTAGNTFIVYLDTATGQFKMYADGLGLVLQGGDNYADGEWRFFQFMRDAANRLSLRVGDIGDATTTEVAAQAAVTHDFNSTNPANIGALFNGSGNWAGALQDWRATVGVTPSILVPTAPFPIGP